MWKSLPTRCPRFWTEYGCRNSRGRTVLCRNVSSLRARRGNPNWSGGGYGVREIASQRGVHGGHGHGHALSWSGASTQVERDAIDGGGQWRTRGGAEGGRRGGCRAVVAGDSEVGGSLDGHMHAGRIQDCDVRGESGARSGAVAIEKRPHCDEEVVKTFSTEEVYKNMLQPSRSGGSSGFGTGSTMYGGGAVRYVKLDDEEASVGSGDRKTKAADVRNMAVDPEDGGQNGGSKRNFLRIQSEFVWPRLLSQGKALAGADYRRRRTILDPSKFGGNGPFRQGSLREFTHHAASETFLITRLAFTLLKYLGIGTRWIGKFIRLSLYAIFLMPGFIQVGYFYYFDKRIHRSITYGDQPRNRFDLYIPPDSDKPKPVVIFITGGAWVIGYKAWGSLLAQQLVERDIIVACIDYRNFPQGSISVMISDVTTGIGYVYQNIENYGGDPNMVHLAGQSAGAHLAACALLMQAEKEISEDPAKLVWRASQMKSYMAISGGYNLIMLVEHFHKRGLYKSIMLRVMEGEKSLPMYSPEYMVKTPTFEKAVSLLPSITLFHGTADYSIPHEASVYSVAFAAALRSVGARVNTVFYPDKTHTDLFLQDPMRGGKDELLADILAIVHANDEEAKAEDVKKAYFRRRLVPEILLKLARAVSPF